MPFSSALAFAEALFGGVLTDVFDDFHGARVTVLPAVDQNESGAASVVEHAGGFELLIGGRDISPACGPA